MKNLPVVEQKDLLQNSFHMMPVAPPKVYLCQTELELLLVIYLYYLSSYSDRNIFFSIINSSTVLLRL